MTEEIRPSLLRRMTGDGRPPPEFGEVSPAKALRLALAKAGQDVLGQMVAGSGVAEQKVPVSKISDLLPTDGLPVLLSGPGGCQGLVAMDRAVVTAVTEALTIGRIGSGPLPERNATATDAVLCQRFLVLLMTVFAARLVGHPASEWATGFVPEDPVPDLRRLPLLMDDVPYRMLTIDVDLGMGARTGQMAIVLPWEGQGSGDTAATERPADAGPAWTEGIQRAVLPVETVLEAVLYSFHLPLSKVMALQDGAVLPLPRRSIAEVELRDGDGAVVTRVRLGQSQGFRAVRLEQVPLRPDLSPTEDLDGTAGSAITLDPVAALAAAGPQDDSTGFDIDGGAGGANPVDGMAIDVGGLPDLPDLPTVDPDTMPEVADDAMPMEDLPQIDIGSMAMDDLDDLPMTIE